MQSRLCAGLRAALTGLLGRGERLGTLATAHRACGDMRAEALGRSGWLSERDGRGASVYVHRPLTQQPDRVSPGRGAGVVTKRFS